MRLENAARAAGRGQHFQARGHSFSLYGLTLGADHLTLEGGLGGGGGMGDFEKIFSVSACWKKTIACSTNEEEKKSCTAGGLYKIPAKLQPFRIICKPAIHSG